jgi:hypothetical protein
MATTTNVDPVPEDAYPTPAPKPLKPWDALIAVSVNVVRTAVDLAARVGRRVWRPRRG